MVIRQTCRDWSAALHSSSMSESDKHSRSKYAIRPAPVPIRLSATLLETAGRQLHRQQLFQAMNECAKGLKILVPLNASTRLRFSWKTNAAPAMFRTSWETALIRIRAFFRRYSRLISSRFVSSLRGQR